MKHKLVTGIMLEMLLLVVVSPMGVSIGATRDLGLPNVLNPDKLKVYGSGTPHISSTSPAQNALRVPVAVTIVVKFDVDMNELTINSSTFVVNARSTGRHEGTITLRSMDWVYFDPDVDFDEGEVVTVVLTKEIRSLDGTPLEESYAWSFTTVVNGGGVGAGTFDPPLNYPVGESAKPASVFAADLNGDGDIDLATANPGPTISGPDKVSVLLNDGCEGLLFDYEQYPVSGEDYGLVLSVFAADLNGDGHIDLATANVEGHSVSVLLNTGKGTFDSFKDYSLESDDKNPYEVTAADLDGDGDIDLATPNSRANNVSVLFNDGNGAFSLSGDYQVGSTYPRHICAADVNNDGHIDLITTNQLSHQGTVLLNNGDGTFEDNPPYQVFSTGDYPHTVFPADLDSDNYLDLAIASWGSDTVSVLLNNGNGTFATKVDYSVSQDPRSVFAADLDGDGDLDLATANESHFSDTVSVLLNNGDGTFGARQDYSIGSVVDAGPKSIFAADLDGDTDLDLVTANGGYDNVSVLLNRGAPFFPSGNFKFGRVDMRLGHKTVNLIDFRPTLDSTVEVHDMEETGTAGYTDHHGKVTFQIPIQCKDRSGIYNAYFSVKVKVYEYEGGPLVTSNRWSWHSDRKRTKKDVLDVCTLQLAPEETRTYWVEVNTYAGRGIPFIRNIPLLSGYSWWDTENGTVRITSRAHPPYQQQVKICMPHPMDTYTIGEDQLVRVRVQYYDSITERYYRCTNTTVCIHVVRDDGYVSEIYYGQTDGMGEVNWVFNIPPEHLAEGTLTITAADLPKDTGFIDDSDLDDGDQVVIQAVNPEDTNTFGVFAVPHSSVIRGYSQTYTVGVVSINFVGDVTLSVSDLPEGTFGWFDPNTVSIPANKIVVSNLTIVTEDYTPLGLHQFTISATSGTLTRDFTCPLLVELPETLAAFCRLQLGALVRLYGEPSYPGGLPQVKVGVISEDSAGCDEIYDLFTNPASYPSVLGPYANVVYQARPSPEATSFDAELTGVIDSEARLLIHMFSAEAGEAFILQWANWRVKAVPVGINVVSHGEGFWYRTGGACEYETISDGWTILQWQAGRLEVVWPPDHPDSRIWAIPSWTYPYPTDINRDGKIDIADIAIVAYAFGTSPGDLRWQFVADVTGDDEIDGDDLTPVAFDYGQTIPIPLEDP